ncbi:MAG: DUF2118 domain-containing protein [Desulfurococcaceae archaeon]
MNISYRFPEIYVEGLKSNRNICFSNGEFVLLGDKIEDVKCDKIYGLIPFESVIEYLDLESARSKVEMIVLKPRKDSAMAYFIKQGTSICIQEIKGKTRYLLLEEGDLIKRGDKIAYVITGKMETRNIMSLCEGRVLFIIDITWETPGKTILVTVLERAREIAIRESA